MLCVTHFKISLNFFPFGKKIQVKLSNRFHVTPKLAVIATDNKVIPNLRSINRRENIVSDYQLLSRSWYLVMLSLTRLARI